MLSEAEIDDIEKAAKDLAEAGETAQAWIALQPLLAALLGQRYAARAVLRIVGTRSLTTDQAVEALEIVERSNNDDQSILCAIGERLEAARNIDFLNAPPPESAIFERIVSKLASYVGSDPAQCDDERLLSALACASRQMSRRYDDLSERCYRRLVELCPADSSHHYNFGLFFKTRGKFEQGVTANQTARALAKEDCESYDWNLGICATGAGLGELALDVWKRMGHKVELGRIGLPEGRFSECKVRLAERPLAERGAHQDDPGLEETVWIERLSACHGIIRSVLYEDLGVDYGDVILFDGAPITYHQYGDEKVPVFPHLATLIRRNYQFFNFVGTQQQSKQITSLSRSLTSDSVIYSHTENFHTLCMECWKGGGFDHEHHEKQEVLVVRGRIAASPEICPADLLLEIDAAASQSAGCRVYAPDLCVAAGEAVRADFETRKFNQLY